MDERNILIGSKESQDDFHEDRRRKRHIFVLALFFMLVLLSYLLILATSLNSYEQTNSLVRNSQLINSSIVINIIVNGKNETEMLLKTFYPLDQATEVPTESPAWDDLPSTEHVYQKPDIGLLRIGNEFGDRHVRPYEPLIQPAVEEDTTMTVN